MMHYVLALVSPADLVGKKWLQNLLHVSSAGREGFKLDSVTPAEVCGAGSWEKNPQGKKKALKKAPFSCQLSTTMPESLQHS